MIGNARILAVLRVPPTDLEDRIRELCARAIAGDHNFQSVISELRSAMREHIQKVRRIAAQQFAGGKSNPTPEE